MIKTEEVWRRQPPGGARGGSHAAVKDSRRWYYARLGLKGKSRYAWVRFHDCFDVEKEPNELNHTNPRADNRHGHIFELIPPGAGQPGHVRHDAGRFSWSVLLLAGEDKDGARYHPQTREYGQWLSCPDNITFDRQGRLWIAADQGSSQGRNGIPDGLYACDLEGPGRGLVKFFYAVPQDAEMRGPCFTPDGTTLFAAVQHPGEDSTFDAPTTRWPDFRDDMPPRPAVVAIRRQDGRPIG